MTVLLLALSPQSLVLAEVVVGVDRESGLRTWEWRHEGISVHWVERLPDQTRAFFLARGFTSQAADEIGRGCVFQTIFRNDGPHRVEYDLADWRVIEGKSRHPLGLKETWDGRWRELGVSSAGRIAFRWALLPTRQSFEPGDYNWGMTSFHLPPGASFDLSLLVEVDGQAIHARIQSMQCPVDRS